MDLQCKLFHRIVYYTRYDGEDNVQTELTLCTRCDIDVFKGFGVVEMLENIIVD